MSDLLASIGLVEPDLAVFGAAGLLPGRALRSLDAVHLASALRLQSPELIGYDSRVLAAARDVGIHTRSPE